MPVKPEQLPLYKEYRGKGIGTELLRRMLVLLRDKGYRQVSLAVQKANYAVKMYRKAGFQTVDENDQEYIMVCRLQEPVPEVPREVEETCT